MGTVQRMLKFNLYRDFLRCRRSGFLFLFLLTLAAFAISPIADAYTDSLSSSLCEINDQIDSTDVIICYDVKIKAKHNSLSAVKRTDQHSLGELSRLRRTLLEDSPAHRSAEREFPFFAIKSSQICPPLSSDPSPPVA